MAFRSTVFAWSVVAAALAWRCAAIPVTVGNGLAGVPLRPQESIVLFNHTLTRGDSHAVMHHFWVTGPGTYSDSIWVAYYVDDDGDEPSILFQPSMMCGVGFPAAYARRNEPQFAAGSLCGKNAIAGGWWNTFPIPFYRNILIKVWANANQGTHPLWLNVRGTVDLPLVMPGLGSPLPFGTRMFLHWNPLTLAQPQEFVDVAVVPSGRPAIVFLTSWAVESKPVGGPEEGGDFIEGCWNFYRQANESYPGLVVGTGVEDYFESSYYFSADTPPGLPRLFTNPVAGVTTFERTKDGYERISAYRFHNSDPLTMSDGGRLTWSVGSQTIPGRSKCGNVQPQGFLASGEPGEPSSSKIGRTLSAVNVTTYAWVFYLPRPETTLPNATRTDTVRRPVVNEGEDDKEKVILVV